MIHLLDTCAFLRFASQTEGELGKLARDVLTDENAAVYYSPLTAVEMEFSRNKKRRAFTGSAIVLIQKIAKEARWKPLSFDDLCAQHIPYLIEANLQDPFDVMIAATALAHEAILLTCDRKLVEIPELKTLW